MEGVCDCNVGSLMTCPHCGETAQVGSWIRGWLAHVDHCHEVSLQVEADLLALERVA